MSYSQRFSRTVSVPYSGTTTVRYPASQNGGTITVNYSGTTQEEVVVDVHVDTSPFDSSVAGCNNKVNNLTASVGAMNTAQCIAITKNANKVSKTIIDGFFHSIRTDISTQKIELEQIIEAKLLLLRQQVATIANIKKNMTEDYQRTTARYQKIFEDLNNELSIRIHEVDQPVFKLAQIIDMQNDRMLHTDMVQIVTAFGKESSFLQSQIKVASVKRHALEALSQAKQFLISKAQTESTIYNTCIDGSGNASYLVPVCYMCTESENNRVEQKCSIPENCTTYNENIKERLCNILMDTNFASVSEDEHEQVKSYLHTEITNNIKSEDAHAERVKAMINYLFTQQS